MISFRGKEKFTRRMAANEFQEALRLGRLFGRSEPLTDTDTSAKVGNSCPYVSYYINAFGDSIQSPWNDVLKENWRLGVEVGRVARKKELEFVCDKELSD
jgi:hypothetical protein